MPETLRAVLISTIAVALALTVTAGCSSPTNPTWEDAFDTSSAGFLSNVWGSGPSDVFIVGGTDTAEIYHYDGNEFSPMAPPAGTETLIWSFGFGPDNVYAVGLSGTVIHYDGSVWSTLDPGTTEDLWGVWGSSPTDIWIVGGSVATGDPVILHHDGQTFTPVALDAAENPLGAHALFKVFGIGSKVFAVGQMGLIVEYNGAAWVRVPAGVDADSDFVSLWGVSETEIVAVGGRGASRIATYNGTTFDTIKPDSLGGTNAVFMVESGEAFVGGAPGYAGRFDLSSGEVTVEAQTLHDVHGMWSDGAGTTYAVGGIGFPPYAGVAIVLEE